MKHRKTFIAIGLLYLPLLTAFMFICIDANMLTDTNYHTLTLTFIKGYSSGCLISLIIVLVSILIIKTDGRNERI